MAKQQTGGVTFESFDFNWNNFQMGEWNSTAQGSGEVISPVIPKFDSLIESLSRKDSFSLEGEW